MQMMKLLIQLQVAITLKSPTAAHGVHASSIASDVPGPSQNQPTQMNLKIANGSVVVVQDQSSGNISRKNIFIFFSAIKSMY